MQIFEAIHPLELAAFLRGLSYNYRGAGSLTDFLPEVNRASIEVSFVTGTRVVTEVGRYRAWDTEAGISGRPGMSRTTLAVPPLAEKMILSEEDRLRLELARFFQGAGIPQEMVDAIFADAANLAKKILARWEYARGQVLTTGRVDFLSTETGMKGGLDFTGIRALLTATASPLWSDRVAATPLADERAWIETYRNNNDLSEPVIGLTSRRVLNALSLTDDVRNAVTPVGLIPPSVSVNPSSIEQYRSAWGLPPLRLFETMVKINGTSTRVIPDNVIVYLPAPDIDEFGETTIGLTTDGLDLAAQVGKPVSVGVGMTGLVTKTFDPNHIWTKVSAMGAPVLKDPGKILVATVLS